MILSCPSCSKRFLLDAGLLGGGRRVKCGNCAHIWYQDPPADQAPKRAASTRPTASVAAPDPAPSPFPQAGGDADGTGGMSSRFSAMLEQDEEDDAPRFPRPAVVEEPGPSRFRAALPWAGLAASIALVAFGLFSGRDAVVAAWPAANRLYELAGMPVEPVGAGLQPVYTAEYREVEGNPMLFVTGEIRNTSDKVREVPDLVATAIDPDGKRVQTWLIQPSARRLFPSQAASFSSIQPEGESQAKEIAVDFKAPPDRR